MLTLSAFYAPREASKCPPKGNIAMDVRQRRKKLKWSFEMMGSSVPRLYENSKIKKKSSREFQIFRIVPPQTKTLHTERRLDRVYWFRGDDVLFEMDPVPSLPKLFIAIRSGRNPGTRSETQNSLFYDENLRYLFILIYSPSFEVHD